MYTNTPSLNGSLVTVIKQLNIDFGPPPCCHCCTRYQKNGYTLFKETPFHKISRLNTNKR